MKLTDEEILKEAYQFGIWPAETHGNDILAFARRIAELQMEKDAEICENLSFTPSGPATVAQIQRSLCARQIRAQKGDEVMEIETPVRTVMVRRLCEIDNCNGIMESTGIMKPSNPPWFEHRCPKCSVYADYRTKYPYFKYIEIEVGAVMDSGEQT